MRIIPVTGDLPALATSAPPPAKHVAEPAPAPATPPVERTTPAGKDAGGAAGDHRPGHKPFFDPPLIAQRAVLGLPTGFLIADFAKSQDIPYAAAAAAVEREMPRQVG